MSSLLYEISHDQQVATIMLNKPETHNALDLEMLDSFNKYLKIIKASNTIKILIIKAKGKHFSSGADLKWMIHAINYNKQQNVQDAKKLAKILWSLYTLNKPIIVILHGNVYGGAIGIVACADVVIATKATKFCFSEVKLGLIPAVISPFILQVMPMYVAKYQMLTAKGFDVVTAAKFGLVHEIIEHDQVVATIAKEIANLLSLSYNSLVAVKKLLKQLSKPISLRTLYNGVNKIAKLRVSSDAQQRISEFLNHE